MEQFIKNFAKIMRSTDFKSVMLKFSLFFVIMTLSLIDVSFSIVAFLLITLFAAIEFSYTSVVWLMLYISANPYTPLSLITLSEFVFASLFLTKFILDVINKKFQFSKINIFLIAIWGVIVFLFIIPFAPHYDLKLSIVDIVAITIITIILINHKQLDIKTILTVFAIYVAAICLMHNILGTCGLCYYRQIYYGGVNRYSLFVNDPNYTAGIILIAFSCICVLKKSSQIKNYLFYPLFIILGTFLFNTISKAGFFSYILMLSLLIANTLAVLIKNKSKNIKELLFLLSSIVLVCLLSGPAFGTMLSRAFNFTNFSQEDILSELTTARSDIYLIYLKEIFNTPYELLFGHGTNAPILEFAPSDFRDTHCTALTMLYRYGLAISLLTIALYIISFIKSKQKANWFNICFSTSILLMYMSISARFFTQCHVFIFIFLIACGIKDKNASTMQEKFDDKDCLTDKQLSNQ